MGKRLFVGNLAWAATDQDLIDLLGVGVVGAKVIMDRETGRSRGFAFVETESDADAVRIMHEFNGSELHGRAMRINEAEERTRSDRPHSSGGGGGGGSRYAPSPSPEFRRKGGGSRRRGREHDGDSW